MTIGRKSDIAKRESASPRTPDHIQSHTFFFPVPPFLLLSFFGSLWLPFPFFSPPAPLFFSFWPFYSVSFSPLHNTKTRRMYLDCKCTVKDDDMSTGHCVLTEQRKPVKGLRCSLYPQSICASVCESKAGEGGLKYLLVKMTPDCGREHVSAYHCTLTSTLWPCETPNITRMRLWSHTVKVI